MIWFSNEPLFGNTLSQLVTKEQLAKMDSTIKPVEVRSNINFAVTELNRDNCDQICCSFFQKQDHFFAILQCLCLIDIFQFQTIWPFSFRFSPRRAFFFISN